LVKDIQPGPGYGVAAGRLANVAGVLYFSANDGSTGVEVWKSDGTAGGTALGRDLRPGAASSFPAGNVLPIAESGGLMFFNADDGSTGAELWQSDGTAAGTVLVADVNPGVAASNPSWMVNAGGTLVFAASTQAGGFELHRAFNRAAPAPIPTPANKSPVFATNFKVNLRPIMTTRGLSVSALLGTKRTRGAGDRATTDAPGSRRGIALTQLRTAGGRFEYRLGGRGPWRPVNPLRVGGTSALLLRENDRVRFKPGPAAGRLQLQYRAWDQTSGSAGRFVNAARGGGSSAFSTARKAVALAFAGRKASRLAEAATLSTTPSTKSTEKSAALLLDALFERDAVDE
ncbi:MAG: ELWxxDGT repeat protein, partial [Planctomycetia bacterium]